MFENGLRKALAGITTIEEVLRVTREDCRDPCRSSSTRPLSRAGEVHGGRPGRAQRRGARHRAPAGHGLSSRSARRKRAAAEAAVAARRARLGALLRAAASPQDEVGVVTREIATLLKAGPAARPQPRDPHRPRGERAHRRSCSARCATKCAAAPRSPRRSRRRAASSRAST